MCRSISDRGLEESFLLLLFCLLFIFLFFRTRKKKHCISAELQFSFMFISQVCFFLIILVVFCMSGEKNSWCVWMCARVFVCMCLCAPAKWTCGKSLLNFSLLLYPLFFFHFYSASISLCLPVSASTTDWLITQPGMRDSFYRYNVAIVIIKWRDYQITIFCNDF